MRQSLAARNAVVDPQQDIRRKIERRKHKTQAYDLWLSESHQTNAELRSRQTQYVCTRLFALTLLHGASNQSKSDVHGTRNNNNNNNNNNNVPISLHVLPQGERYPGSHARDRRSQRSRSIRATHASVQPCLTEQTLREQCSFACSSTSDRNRTRITSV